MGVSHLICQNSDFWTWLCAIATRSHCTYQKWPICNRIHLETLWVLNPIRWILLPEPFETIMSACTHEFHPSHHPNFNPASLCRPHYQHEPSGGFSRHKPEKHHPTFIKESWFVGEFPVLQCMQNFIWWDASPYLNSVNNCGASFASDIAVTQVLPCPCDVYLIWFDGSGSNAVLKLFQPAQTCSKLLKNIEFISHIVSLTLNFSGFSLNES